MVNEVQEEGITGFLMGPIGGFFLTFFLDLCDDLRVKSVAIGAMT